MRSSIVPAQITTVEDKVAGNLSVQQLFLLVTPVFVGGLLYVLAPSMFGIETYKVVVTTAVAAVCLISAIRIQGTLVVYWIVKLATYHLRPRIYVSIGDDAYLREPGRPTSGDKKVAPEDVGERLADHTVGSALLTAKLQNTAHTKGKYRLQKGKLHVSYVEEK